MIEGILSVLKQANEMISGAAVPLVLLSAGVGYLLYLRAFHFRHPVLLACAMTRPSEKHGKTESGGVSPFRAVTLALAGTLGVGNLVGVAGAIALGGPGSVFWMLISAFLAMLLKYAEIVLALRHREVDEKGNRHGGAMYYIRDGFRRIGLPRVGVGIAAIFAVFCIFDSLTMGCVIQMNAVGSAFSGVFGWPSAVVGGVLAVVTFFVIIGGGKRISALTERLVPFMTLIYLVLSAAVLILRRDALSAAVSSVFQNAFRLDTAASGVGGFLFSRAVRYGTMRGLMSNEAGCGTAPIAHAESNTDSPAQQGIWGIFEVFADTVVLCSLTAAVILVSYDKVAVYGENGMMMTLKAYSSVLGTWSEPLFAFLVLFFAFATVVCWAHYGASALAYFTKRRIFHIIYIAAFSVAVFLGTNAAPSSVWIISDFALGVMTVLNVTVLWGMRREVKAETLHFLCCESMGTKKRRRKN